MGILAARNSRVKLAATCFRPGFLNAIGLQRIPARPRLDGVTNWEQPCENEVTPRSFVARRTGPISGSSFWSRRPSGSGSNWPRSAAACRSRRSSDGPHLARRAVTREATVWARTDPVLVSLERPGRGRVRPVPDGRATNSVEHVRPGAGSGFALSLRRTGHNLPRQARENAGSWILIRYRTRGKTMIYLRAVWAFCVVTFLTGSFVYALISPGPVSGGPL